MKRAFLAVLTIVILLSTLIFLPTTVGTVSVEAASNIILNGVDIGYALGDFFTKNGKSCATSAFSNGTCHGHNICVTNTDARCNCMRYWPSKSNYQVDLKATQCMGFARYCQWKLFGFHDGDGKNNNKFVNITGTISKSSCTGTLLKSKLLGCQVGTHIRTGDNGHSMVVASTSSTNIKIIACNMKVNGVKSCKIYSKNYTWEEFATYLKGRSGVLYAKATSSSSSSSTSNSNNPDNYTYPTRSLTYTSPTMKGDDVKWVQAVLCKLGYTVDIDGSYGKGSVAAIKEFQADNGLTVDGKCGPATRAKLLERWNAKKASTSHTHSYSAATCTSPKKCSCGTTSGSALGHTYYNSCDTSCNRCGATRSTSHTFSNACDTSCNVCGISRAITHKYSYSCDTSCNTCGATRTITHKYNSGVITTTPTCKLYGIKTYTCSLCTATKTEILKKTSEHKYGIWAQTKAATCTEKGQETRTCAVCNKTETKDINPTGHNFDEWRTVKQPTTESVGEAQRSCKNKNCSAKESKTIAKLPHDGHTHKYGEWTTVVAATCVSNGTTERNCSVCGATETATSAYTEHVFNEWEIIIEPTENSEGEKKRKCANCSKTETAVIEKLPQTASNENQINEEKQPTQSKKIENGGKQNNVLIIVIGSLAVAALCGVGVFIFFKKKKH